MCENIQLKRLLFQAIGVCWCIHFNGTHNRPKYLKQNKKASFSCLLCKTAVKPNCTLPSKGLKQKQKFCKIFINAVQVSQFIGHAKVNHRTQLKKKEKRKSTGISELTSILTASRVITKLSNNLSNSAPTQQQ